MEEHREMGQRQERNCARQPVTGPVRYALITPARNEAEFIAGTIASVVNQTLKPVRWIIVSDGSTDGTDEIVKLHTAQYDWIELIRMPERPVRSFAGKARAFKAGMARLEDVRYDIIGNLDADITFEPEYLAFLMEKFALDPALGVAGTPFREGSFQYDYRFTNKEHVSGACQLFRRECFEAIGGYVPLKTGGIDLMAVLSARMKGWKTESFANRFCEHHRKVGTARRSLLQAVLRRGYQDYLMGAHPVWELFRCAYQTRNSPFVVGGFLLLAGYVFGAVTRPARPMSKEMVRFRRADQISRLTQLVRRLSAVAICGCGKLVCDEGPACPERRRRQGVIT